MLVLLELEEMLVMLELDILLIVSFHCGGA
jgi:hypothetical protein